MATVSIKASGNPIDGAILEGAASEETLSSLLSQFKDSGHGLKSLSQSLKKIIDNQQKQFKQTDQMLKSLLNSSKKVVSSGSGSDKKESSAAAESDKALDHLGDTASEAAGGLAALAGMSVIAKDGLAAVAGMSQNAEKSLEQLIEEQKKAAEDQEANQKKLNEALNKVEVGLHNISAVIGTVISVIGDLINSGITFAKWFFTTETKLSSFTHALDDAAKQFPIIGGILSIATGALNGFVSYVEEARDVQADMAASGAAFNNNLMAMRGAAAATGMGLKEFASIVSSNSQNLAMFGSVTKGALALGEASKKVRSGLLNMGMSLEQINGELPEAMSLFAAGVAGQNISTEKLADSAAGLMTEMDAMARLTGKSRKEQMDALKKQQSSAAFQMKMASMDIGQREMINKEMARMQAQFGDVGAELVKVRVLGIGPITEEARMMTATMPGVADGINKFTDGVMSGAQSAATFGKDLNDTTVEVVKSGMASGKSMENVLQAAAAGIGGGAEKVAKNFDTLMANSGKFMNKDKTLNEEAFRAQLEQIDEQQKQSDKMLAVTNKIEEVFRKVKEAIMDKVITPIMDKAGPVFEKIAAGGEELAKKFADFIQNSDAFKWVMKQLEDLPATLDGLPKWINETAIPAITDFANNITAIGEKVMQVGGILFDAVSFVSEHLTFFGGLLAAGVVAFIAYNALIVASNIKTALQTLAIMSNTEATAAAAGVTALSTEATEAATAAAGASSLSLGAMASAVWGAVTSVTAFGVPIIPVIAAVWALWEAFNYLYDNGWSLSTAWEAIKENISSAALSLGDVILSIVEKLGKFLGFETKGIHQLREKIADQQHEFALSEQKRDQERAKEAESRNKDQEDLDRRAKLTDAEKNQTKQIDKNTDALKKENEEKEKSRLLKQYDWSDADKAVATPAAQNTQTTDTTPPLLARSAPSTSAAFTGMTAKSLKDQGLKIKEGDVQAEGKTLSPKLIDLAKKVQENIPGFRVITGLNDRFHNEKKPKSLHTKGLAMDFVLTQPPSDQDGKSIVAMLKKMGASDAIDEYNHPSSHATAGHIHAEVAVPKARFGKKFSGPESGYLQAVELHGTETVVNADQETAIASAASVLGDMKSVSGAVEEAIQSLVSSLSTAGIGAGSAKEITRENQATGTTDLNMVFNLQELVRLQERSVKLLGQIAENV